MKKHPPLINFILETQKKYPDSIICSEIGSFFEIHEIDGLGYAKEASSILDIVLTRKNKSDPDSPYMTGFPVHTAKNHFKKLAAAGKTVIVLTQDIRGKRSDQNKGVGRKISQIISPGTVLELPDETRNYLCSIIEDDGCFGIAAVDVSTGEVIVAERSQESVNDFISSISPAEFLLASERCKIKETIGKPFHEGTLCLSRLSDAALVISSVYGIENPTSNKEIALTPLGLEFYRLGSISLGTLLNYLSNFNPLLLKKISKPKILETDKKLFLSKESINALGLLGSNPMDQSLFSTLNKCKTSMGKRKLKEWISSPSRDKDEIKKRHDQVSQFCSNGDFLQELSGVYDIARLSRRAALQTLLTHEIYYLYDSLAIIEKLNKKLNVFNKDKIAEIINSISKTINIDCRIYELNSDFFCSLPDDLFSLSEKIKTNKLKLLTIKDNLQSRLGTDKLRLSEKLDSIKLIGPKSLHKKATELNISSKVRASDSEFYPENWDEIETALISDLAVFQVKATNLWEKFQSKLSDDFGTVLYELSEAIAEIDVLSSFALLSKERGYFRPIVSEEEQTLNLINLRHPVVERSALLTESYVPNDLCLSEYGKKSLVLYGPNSSGKSTFVKSVGICAVMNQIGCFIPASAGSIIPIFDAIFTRATSSDKIDEGLSTFVVEMNELNSALINSDKKCLYILDEVGRGTDSSDGEGLAYGTIKFLDDKNKKCITLFATHYHGLYENINELDSVVVKNVSCVCTEEGELLYFRKLSEGPGAGSYGIEVAKSCGIPKEIISLAKNYKKTNFSFKRSNYNSRLSGTTCELCKENPVRETHHIHEQKQGKVKRFYKDGIERGINDLSNIVLLCSNCHVKVTRKEIIIIGKIKTSSGFILDVSKN